LDHCPAHPSIDVLKLKHGKIKGMPPSNTATLIQPMDQDIIWAFKAYDCGELLGGVAALPMLKFLKTLTLKDVAYGADLVWGKIMPTTIAHCYEKCSWKDDVTVDERQN
jgi:hypothetical protein